MQRQCHLVRFQIFICTKSLHVTYSMDAFCMKMPWCQLVCCHRTHQLYIHHAWTWVHLPSCPCRARAVLIGKKRFLIGNMWCLQLLFEMSDLLQISRGQRKLVLFILIRRWPTDWLIFTRLCQVHLGTMSCSRGQNNDYVYWMSRQFIASFHLHCVCLYSYRCWVSSLCIEGFRQFGGPYPVPYQACFLLQFVQSNLHLNKCKLFPNPRWAVYLQDLDQIGIYRV